MELSFERVISPLREAAANIPNRRSGTNCHYSIRDVALRAFSVLFTQSPSFLDFERRLKQRRSEHTTTLFVELSAAGELERSRSIAGDLLVTIDGTEYHPSEEMHCEHSRLSEHTNGA